MRFSAAVKRRDDASTEGSRAHQPPRAGLGIDPIQFGDFMQDHPDYHGAEAAYFAAQARILERTPGDVDDGAVRVLDVADPEVISRSFSVAR